MQKHRQKVEEYTSFTKPHILLQYTLKKIKISKPISIFYLLQDKRGSRIWYCHIKYLVEDYKTHEAVNFT